MVLKYDTFDIRPRHEHTRRRRPADWRVRSRRIFNIAKESIPNEHVTIGARRGNIYKKLFSPRRDGLTFFFFFHIVLERLRRITLRRTSQCALGEIYFFRRSRRFAPAAWETLSFIRLRHGRPRSSSDSTATGHRRKSCEIRLGSVGPEHTRSRVLGLYTR